MPTPLPDDRPKTPTSGNAPTNPIFPPKGMTARQPVQFHKSAAGGAGSPLRKSGSIVLAVVAVLVLFALAYAGRLPWMKSEAGNPDVKSSDAPAVEWDKDRPKSLRVPEEVRKSLGIQKGVFEQIAVAEVPTRKVPLVMPGSTAIDPARLIRVRVRFAPAEVVEIGKIDDPHVSPGSVPPARRDLQAGDQVHKGDLLAVLYSVDLGNKKNDLFDALSQLRLDQEVFKRAEAHSAAVPEVFLLNAQRNVQADLNAVNRAENTLKTWAVPDEEIQAVRDEVKKITGEPDRRADAGSRLKQWARVDLRAPDDGVIIEQNVALHETVVDNTTNLIQLAKVDPLIVLASVPEDDLPALQDLKNRTHNHMEWTVRTVGSKPMVGFVDDIGYLIDPNQHTAVVRGHIPNRDGLLRAGQFVTATVDLPPPKDVVEVPIGALVEDGKDSIVFVQTDPKEPVYTIRRVEVTNRFDRTAYVRSSPMMNKDDEHVAGTEPLKPGERVITAGALELKTALENKISESASKPDAPKSP
jgi:cobalt-zinc-cadmium efflux system membrane fusion protein